MERQEEKEFKINAYCLMENHIHIVLMINDDNEINGGKNFLFPDFIRSEQSSPDEYFITSRIDNDDAFERTYIEQIQNFVGSFPEKKTCFITFPYGEQFDVTLKRRQAWFYDINHFTSMFAPANMNILQYNHGRIKESGYEVICLKTDKPMWTEVIHPLNFANIWIENNI